MPVSSAYMVLYRLVFLLSVTSTVVGREYCETETFEAKCAQDEVVVITRAQYGRMRKGRCIESSFGYPLGCSENVQVNLDRWCSGRQSCKVDVAKLLRDISPPCPKELRNYLDAEYTCVPVIGGHETECTSGQTVAKPMTQPEGYISSLIAMETGCGSIDSPWLITVGSGQTISMTLYDFSVINSLNSDADDSVCLVKAIIKEPSGGLTQTVCSGKVRQSHAYSSLTNSVEVRVVSSRQQQADEGFFLLKYEAVGCPQPHIPEGAWAERKDSSVTMGCDDSRVQWKMDCVGREWVGKQPSNCTSADRGEPVSLDAVLDIPSLPKGSSLLIIIGVACLVGLVVLISGFVCLRRHYNRPIHIRGGVNSLDDPYTTTVSMDRDGSQRSKNPHMMDPYRENQYYRTWQLQQKGGRASAGATPTSQAPPPPYDPVNVGSGSTNQDGRYVEHIYESPKFERHEISPHGESGGDHAHVKYFELDPSASAMHKGQSSRDNLSTSTSGYRSDSLVADRVDL